eukprot:TRINITY_DN3612_c1_g5_i2.p1 TRINITY_DN3612_c1_g5~~TRINITY_DN3612_c1_g5_i2.p1  ORF type:complete len:327 (-),score=73.61 TRINITY_DN3612_c1_g5_i2:187-1167(-)
MAAATAMNQPTCCLLLVCGLPGCGKSTFCKSLIARAEQEKQLLGACQWRHLCYDEVEMELRGQGSTHFDPDTWRESRVKAAQAIAEIFENHEKSNESLDEKERLIVLLDDNMYYRSMRKQWYHFARKKGYIYRQVFLESPKQVCLERNRGRPASGQVPDFSIEHMAEVFEWPKETGTSWEAVKPITFSLDSSTTSTDLQVDTFVKHFDNTGSSPPAEVEEDFWKALPEEEAESTEAQVQNDVHNCDVALRRIVSRALAQAPKELGSQKSVLAKEWGARKAALAKSITAGGCGEEELSSAELIEAAEVAFLRACSADVQRVLHGQKH